jgi:uncharacterized protein (DUF934 family)
MEDDWQRIAEPDPGQPLPQGDLIVPLDYWRNNREPLARHNGRIAVCLNGDDSLDDFSDSLDQFELVALEFPRFADGRSYSHARLLREKYDYRGEIRAVGEVLRDQLFFMKRCGLDSYQIREDKDAEDALKGLSDFSVKYQTAADGAPPVYKLRHKQGN